VEGVSSATFAIRQSQIAVVELRARINEKLFGKGELARIRLALKNRAFAVLTEREIQQ
jgi:hypothetical protein